MYQVDSALIIILVNLVLMFLAQMGQSYDASWISGRIYYSALVDLADGDYTLTMYDSFGDGGLCAGVYNPNVSAYADYTCMMSGFGFVAGNFGIFSDGVELSQHVMMTLHATLGLKVTVYMQHLDLIVMVLV